MTAQMKRRMDEMVTRTWMDMAADVLEAGGMQPVARDTVMQMVWDEVDERNDVREEPEVFEAWRNMSVDEQFEFLGDVFIFDNFS